jgi:tryptophanyl-tRNA synthetase
MSKSENQLATLYLADDDELIMKKVMKQRQIVGQLNRTAKCRIISRTFSDHGSG